jgi:Mrp family chromosome partitioning ATPase
MVSVEIYRQIYVALDLRSDGVSVIGVTSAIRGEGRTSVALGLATSLAADLDSRVMLVEADFGRHSLVGLFGLEANPNFEHVLRNDVELARVAHPITPQLSVVAGGGSEADASRLIRRLGFHNPFRDLRGLADVVVLDLPPLLTLGYSPLAAGVADAIVLVVRAGVTPAEFVREAIARLEDTPPRGIVLNGTRSPLPRWWPERGL